MSSSKSLPLTPREARFVVEYARTRNAKQSAIAAGYSSKSATVLGPRCLRKPHIVAALHEAGVEILHVARPPGQIRAEKPRSRLRKTLTWRQRRFVEEYLICGNATEAARRIGLSEKNAQANGFRLLRVPLVAEAIAIEQRASAERTKISMDRVRLELARVGFADIGDILDWDGDTVQLRPRDLIAKADRAAIAALKVRPGKHGPRISIRLHSKERALEALAKHLGFYRQGAMQTAANANEEQRDANAILRERLMRIVNQGKKSGEGEV
jgi:phage terminase small subunit